MIINGLTIDVNDLELGMNFWSGAIGVSAERLSEGFACIRTQDMDVLLQLVPEPKASKSRMHIDLGSDQLDTELPRLEKLGAKLVRPPHPDGFRFAVLEDPFGNEFCVLERK
jgi:predicted enzyme related to lactoylglutathione lyase